MLYIIFFVLAVVIAIAGVPITTMLSSRFAHLSVDTVKLSKKVSSVAGLVAVIIFANMSFITVPDNKIMLMKRVYFGSPMEAGQYIAKPGQNGPQARILTPGFTFELFINVLYNLQEASFTSISEGSYGYIVANDGESLRNDQFLADEWSEDEARNMIDGEYFLSHGGQKGPQLSVLKPGVWGINTYLFSIKAEKATSVEAGFVGVVKSNVEISSIPHKSCDEISFTPKAWESFDREIHNQLSVPLVPNGCVGVWKTPLKPNMYYLNRHAYSVTQISTRAETWEYKGGYTRRQIDLSVDEAGVVHSKDSSTVVPVPADAEGEAVKLRIEGWTIPQDIRVIVQVDPEDAPFVVASVGTIDDVRTKILTATIRSSARNITGAKNVRVMDLIENRSKLEADILSSIKMEGAKAGVTMREVRLGDPAIPPELLVSRLREQLANQMKKTFQNELLAQKEREKKEKAKAWADKQPEIVASAAQEIIEKNRAKAEKQKGIGERDRLKEIAKGQKAQVDVLGKVNVQQLAIVDKVLAAAVANPGIVKVPHTNVSGISGSGSLEGAAAILGSSTLTKGINVK